MCAVYQKKVSQGAFLEKGVDVKNGDIVQIANEGHESEGKYGMQTLFLVRVKVINPTSGVEEIKEGNIGFNQTSINCLIDAYGSESKKWIGKVAKTWAIMSNVQGKMTNVYYFTHPNAEIDKDGNFSIPGQVTAQPAQPEPEEIRVEDIPF